MLSRSRQNILFAASACRQWAAADRIAANQGGADQASSLGPAAQISAAVSLLTKPPPEAYLRLRGPRRSVQGGLASATSSGARVLAPVRSRTSCSQFVQHFALLFRQAARRAHFLKFALYREARWRSDLSNAAPSFHCELGCRISSGTRETCLGTCNLRKFESAFQVPLSRLIAGARRFLTLARYCEHCV